MALTRCIPYSLRYRLQPVYERLVASSGRAVSADDPAFFIVGSQRSGTTLLGMMLDSHPGIRVIDEDTAYAHIRNGVRSSEVLLGFKVPIWTARFRMIQNKFPRALFLFMKRDIRSITASMISLRFGCRTWVELNGVTEIERMIPLISDRKQRVFYNGIYRRRIDRRNPIDIAALCAYLKLLWINEYRKAGASALEVRYEKLVLEPRSSIAAILEYLGLDWDDAVLEHHKLHSGTAIGSTNRARPVDSESIEKWHHLLSSGDVARIDAIVNLCREQNKDAESPYFNRSAA